MKKQGRSMYRKIVKNSICLPSDGVLQLSGIVYRLNAFCRSERLI